MTRYEELKLAFKKAIEEIGLVNFKKTSLFIRNWEPDVKK